MIEVVTVTELAAKYPVPGIAFVEIPWREMLRGWREANYLVGGTSWVWKRTHPGRSGRASYAYSEYAVLTLIYKHRMVYWPQQILCHNRDAIAQYLRERKQAASL